MDKSRRKSQSCLWCVCDLDGTLLNSHNTISEQDKEALRMLCDIGAELVLATGRSDLMIKQYVHELGVKMPVIACNGGLIRDQGTGEIIFMKTIETGLAGELLRYCEIKGYDHMAYTSDMVYFSRGNKRTRVFEESNRKTACDFRVPLKETEELMKNPLPQNIIKFLVSNVEEAVFEEMDYMFNSDNDLTIVSSGKGLIDIMASNTTKGEGLKLLSKRFGIDLERTIAFGDNHNDLSMFAICRLPIAVANAEEKVKQAAKIVTLSNDESGVGHAIKKYILDCENVF